MTDVETGYVDVPGGKLYYEVEGEGPAVTLIHAGVAHLRMWDEEVAAWRDAYRVIRYDCRGFGRTRVEDVPYSNRDDLRAVLDHLGVQRTHLLGISRGSMIATDALLETPDRFRSLTWVAGGLRGLEVDDPRLTDIWPEMERLEEARDWEPLVAMETQVWTDGPGQPPDRVDPEVRRKMIAWNMENYLADQKPDQPIPFDGPPAAERLAEIDLPTLLMWGTLDELGVLRSGEKMAAEIRGARSHVFEGVAHMVNLERPAEFNRLVREFLDEFEASA